MANGFHVVYDGPQKKLKVFSQKGVPLFYCEARNDSAADNAWRPDAGCPPGNYTLQQPLANDIAEPSTDSNDWVGEGRWFFPIVGIAGHTGIGIHGGGSCVYPHSLAPRQGWCPTLNCIRLQNEDLALLVHALRGQGNVPISVVQSEAA